MSCSKKQVPEVLNFCQYFAVSYNSARGSEWYLQSICSIQMFFFFQGDSTSKAKTICKNAVAIIDSTALQNKTCTIRGTKIMLDVDLAEIYGYSVKAFNQQVKNNIERFADDFRFQLTEEEVTFLSRSNFLISMQTEGIKGGRVYRPYVFTEQGIYMLMTVLKGDLAIQQSIWSCEKKYFFSQTY